MDRLPEPFGQLDEYGTPVADMPAFTVRVRLTERDGGTRMEMQLRFDSREDLAVGQIDGLLT
jgi:hypothetical protein